MGILVINLEALWESYLYKIYKMEIFDRRSRCYEIWLLSRKMFLEKQ